MKLKNLLANKNVVTILGAVLIVIVLYAFYTWRVNSAINPISVPYAKVTIGPRTEITNDMIGHLEIQQSSLKGKVLTNENTQIIGMYTNVNSTIPEGSLFYEGVIVEYKNLADSFLIKMPKDSEGNYLTSYDFKVNTASTYGNSIYPGNYVDIFFVGKNEDKVMYGKLAANVKVLAVKTGDGRHVFENINENLQPSLIILAVTDELGRLLRVSESVSGVQLKLVPTNAGYIHESEDEIAMEISDDEIKEYIEQYTAS